MDNPAYAPLTCSVPPKKCIFCGAGFSFSIALDLQQKLKTPTFFSRTNGNAIFSWNL